MIFPLLQLASLSMPWILWCHVVCYTILHVNNIHLHYIIYVTVISLHAIIT